MAEQVATDGDLVTTANGNELVCVAVRYQDAEDGTRHSYEYIFRSTAEIDAEAEAQHAAEEAAKAEQAQAEADESARNEQLNNEGNQA